MAIARNRRFQQLVGVMVGATILIAGCGNDDDTEPASPTTATDSTTTVAETPLETGSLVWSRIGLDEAVFPPGSSVNDIVAGGPGLVAVGMSQHEGAEVGVEFATIWTSPDGFAWSQVPYDEEIFGVDVEIKSVAVGGPGLVAVGEHSVWTSGDGITWSNASDLTLDLIDDDMRGVIAGGPGLVAFGETNDDAALWTSSDGLAWSRASDDKEVFGTSSIHGVTQGGPGLVAVGVDESRFPDVVPVIWISADGLAWERIAHDETVFGTAGDFYAAGIASGADLLVVVGSDGFDDQGRNAVVWSSRDGITWSRVPHDEAVFGGDQGEGMTSVVAAGDGFAAVGSEFSPMIWTSPDGESWSRVPYEVAELGEAGGMGKVIARGPGLFVLGGAEEGPAFWVAAPADS